MTFPFHQNPKKLIDFFNRIQKEQKPEKVNKNYLKSLAFKSSYDDKIPSVLKSLGFIDQNGTPTERWQKYRDVSQAKGIMGIALFEGYKGLFSTFSDAQTKSDDDITNYFKANTDEDEDTVKRMVQTFKTLCTLATFEELPTFTAEEPSLKKPSMTEGNKQLSIPQGFVVNVNIQLQLPETSNSEVYDKLFESMKKHLFK